MTRSWRWARAGRVGAGFAIWTLFGLFFTSQAYLAQTYFGRGLSFGDALMRWMSCAYAWALLTPLVMKLCRRFPIDRQRWRAALAVHLPASLAFSVAAMLLFSLAEQALTPSGRFLNRDAFAKLLVAGLNIDLLIYATLVGAVYALDHYRRYRERELSALRAQIHPHFLFNTLNTIGILMEEDARAARKMLVHLGDLLRTLLKAERTQEVSVREEIELGELPGD